MTDEPVQIVVFMATVTALDHIPQHFGFWGFPNHAVEPALRQTLVKRLLALDNRLLEEARLPRRLCDLKP